MTTRSNSTLDIGGIAGVLSRLLAHRTQIFVAVLNDRLDVEWANEGFNAAVSLASAGSGSANLSVLPAFAQYIGDIREALTSGSPCTSFAGERNTPDGVLPSPWFLLPLRNADGSINKVLFVAAAKEIPEEEPDTASALARDHLTLLDAMSDTVLIVDPSTSQVLETNRNVQQLLGFSRDEVRGKRINELSSEDSESIRREIMKRLSRLTEGTQQLFEWRLKRKDGENVWVEVNARGAVLENRPFVIADIRDITARKETQQELLKIREALDDCGSAVIMTSKEGQALYLNAAFGGLFGCTEDRAAQISVSDYFADKNTGPDLLRTIEAGGSWEGETLMLDKSGRVFPALLRCTPVLDEDYDVSGCLIILNDVTERKQLEAQLVQAQNLKSVGQLAAGIAHEINTPIQYVGDNIRFLRDSFTDLLQFVEQCASLVNPDGPGANSANEGLTEIRCLLEKIEPDYLKQEIPLAVEQSLEGINRVTEIIRAMRQFTHPGTTDKKSIDLNRAIENTVLVARNEWKYVADVKIEFDGGLPPVPCYPGDLNQVILNLVVNAAHAIAQKQTSDTQEKGVITISTAQAGENVEIRISDTGMGIPEEIRERVFDPFFTTKDVGKGTGQGLAISHSVVVEKHKGQLYFESEVGKGTTFIVRIPLYESPVAGDSQEPHS